MDRNAFCRALIDWYWRHGSRRTEDYSIPTGTWLRRLYETEEQLAAIGEARAHPRPAMAIWGPSQTGKSTLVAADIDARAKYERVEGVDGSGSALHWPGGAPMFFMSPEAAPPAYLNRYVLNPFNQGWDGSSALTRFVLGTTEAGPSDAHFVRDVRHPVSLHLITPRDLLQVVARGYDTECLGAGRGRDATTWSIPTFESRLARFKRQRETEGKGARSGGGGPAQPVRSAYEILFDVHQVLGDLVFAELPRFKKLRDEGEDNWRSLTASLLSDPVLLADPKAAADFAAEILWDGSEVLTRHHQRLQAELAQLASQWAGRPVLASLEAAALFLNMEACRIYFDPPPPDRETQEGVVHASIARIGWREDAGAIRIGCGPEYPRGLAGTPERFAAVQALVWELVVPLNPANLPDRPFQAYLRDADLLDFAGVGNEPKSDVSRVDLGGGARGDAAAASRGRPFEPVLFYKQIVKRGKTACIVSTYAKRLTIDGFNIFQNVDKYPPVNAPQLINGIETWWKYFVPEYHRSRSGRSPLPLNLGLMWWAPRLAESAGTPERIFKAVVPIYGELGVLADPAVAVTFAFNYYKFPRGRLDEEFTPESRLYRGITASPEFLHQFSHPVSRQSFEAMARDKETGGTDFFFATLRRQLESARANPATNRLALLEARAAGLETEISDLLKMPRLFPAAKVVDVRRLNLERLKLGIAEAAKGKPERQMREINHALRELLDVNYQILLTPPADPAEVDRPFIGRQFRQWVDSQVSRFDQWERSGRRAGPDWTLLGLTTREAVNDSLDALRTSVEHRYGDMAHWMSRVVGQCGRVSSDLRNTQLRRHLAVRMGNELVSGRGGSDDLPDEETDAGGEEPSAPPIGRECLTYRAFIRPFVEEQLTALIALRLDPMMRPENIPGDQELGELCDTHHLRPA
ncbi:MAG TPA: hypothetical protein VGL42_11270 [Opitutaceae bacterium]|jgi:hypothetical protein